MYTLYSLYRCVSQGNIWVSNMWIPDILVCYSDYDRDWSRRVGDEKCVVVHTFYICAFVGFVCESKKVILFFSFYSYAVTFINWLNLFFYSDSSHCVTLCWMQIEYYSQHSLQCYMFHFNKPSSHITLQKLSSFAMWIVGLVRDLTS